MEADGPEEFPPLDRKTEREPRHDRHEKEPKRPKGESEAKRLPQGDGAGQRERGGKEQDECGPKSECHCENRQVAHEGSVTARAGEVTVIHSKAAASLRYSG